MTVVVDASVAVMWYLPHAHGERAIDLLGSGHDLVAPELLALEVSGALLRALRRGELSGEEATEVIHSLLPEAVRLLPNRAGPAEAPLQIAIEHGGSIYDAVYIALARSLDAPISTNDTEMAVTAERSGVRAALIAQGFEPFDSS